jgi:hypothetical protein
MLKMMLHQSPVVTPVKYTDEADEASKKLITPCFKYRLRKSASQSGISVGSGAAKKHNKRVSLPESSCCECGETALRRLLPLLLAVRRVPKAKSAVVSPAMKTATPRMLLLR